MSTNCRADSRQADLESANGRRGLDKRARQLPDEADTPVGEDEVAGAVVEQPGGVSHCGVDGDPGGWVETAAQGRVGG